MGSCRRPCLSQCRGDRGFCGCRNFDSREQLEAEIRKVEQFLEELRAQLDNDYPEIIEESDDDIEDVDETI